MAIGKTKYWQICSILKLIYQNPGITRKELSTLLCVDKAMITHIINYLTADNWLTKQNQFAKKIPLFLNENRLTVAGVEIQPEYQRFAVCNIKGTILYQKEWNYQRPEISDLLFGEITNTINKCGFDIFALGLAIPGVCDNCNKQIIASNPFGIKIPRELPKTIGEKQIPLFIENDTRCLGWNKVAFDKDFGNFLLVVYQCIENPQNKDEYIRISNGMSLFSKGNSWAGAHNCAGEIPDLFNIKEYVGEHNFVPYSEKLKMKNNPEIRSNVLRNIAIRSSYTSTLFDTEKLYIYISGLDAGNDYPDLLKSYMDKFHFYPTVQNTEIVTEALESFTVARGACGFVFENLFVHSCGRDIPQSLIIKAKSAVPPQTCSEASSAKLEH